MLKINDKFIIDWTPKAGVQSIVCKMIFNKLNILNEALNLHYWIHIYREKKYYKKYGKVNKKMLSNKNIIKIKFVRNPYDRAVSSYLHACDTIILRKVDKDDISFEVFLKLLVKNELPNNPHYNLQSFEIENNAGLVFDKIIKLEKLDKHLEELKQEYNLELENIFTSNHNRSTNAKNINYYIGNLNFYEIKKLIPTYNNFYNNETKELVEKIYGKDIELYNYTFEDFMSKYEEIVTVE